MLKGILFVKNWGMSVRQFLMFFIFAFLIFSILLVRNTMNIAETVRQSEQERYQSMANDACRYLDHLKDGINSLISTQSVNWEIFLPGREKDALELLRKYNNYGAYGIRVMYYCRSDGVVLCGKQVLYDIFGNPYVDIFSKEMAGFPYTIRYTGPYYTRLSQEAFAVCSVVRSSNDEALGVLIAEISIDMLKNILSSYLTTSDSGYVLFMPDGTPITYDASPSFLPTVAHTWPPLFSNDILENIVSLKSGFFTTGGIKNGLSVYNTNNNKLGWYLGEIINTEGINQTVRRLYSSMVMEMLTYCLIILVMSFSMTVWLMRPIRAMVLKMRSIRTLSDLSEINGSKWGEVGQIIDSFNFMMRTIGQLKNDSQLYELKMLRSQIGPHFLYNTLSCISLMTKQRREKEVQSTIRSLIDLLSFSFDRRDEFVTLNAELKSVENYIDIQKIRLGSIFTCEIKISDRCGSCLIPKLTLQPIVENAILHGVITRTTSEKKVFIRAKRYGQNLVVFIMDNGMGMDKETIRLIMDTADKLNEKERFSGIGIRNVDQRIKLYYGNKYGLKIRSRPGTGTIVRIAIPAREY